MAFAEEFKAARLKTGMSQAVFAECTGIPKHTVCNWEQAVSAPPEWTQWMLLEVMERMAEEANESNR